MKRKTNKHDNSKKLDEERKKKMADLVRKAKGDNRSFVEYAKAAGISPAALSRIINGHYIPTPKTMRKLTSKAAEPQGGVTYEDLMVAAGYELKESEMAERLSAYAESYDNKNKNSFSIRSNGFERRKIYLEKSLSFEKECINTIFNALVEHGILFRKSEDVIEERIIGNNTLIDLVDQPFEKWLFVYKYFLDTRFIHPMMMDSILASALRLNIKKGTKLSVVINNKLIFQRMKKYDHALSFRGELSIILYDEEKNRFVEECYLANYYEEDRTKEIYLVNR